jgi:hypothetical protein
VEASSHAVLARAGNMTTMPCSQSTVAWNHEPGANEPPLAFAGTLLLR